MFSFEVALRVAVTAQNKEIHTECKFPFFFCFFTLILPRDIFINAFSRTLKRRRQEQSKACAANCRKLFNSSRQAAPLQLTAFTQKIYAATVARLYVAYPNPNKWAYSNIWGAVAFLKDKKTHSLYIRIIDLIVKYT